MPFLPMMTYGDAQKQQSDIAVNDAQKKLIDYKLQQAQQPEPPNVDDTIKKHNFVAQVSKQVYTDALKAGPEGSPEFMSVFNQKMDAFKPYVAQVMGDPRILTAPNSLEHVKAFATWDPEKGDLKNHLQYIPGPNGEVYAADTAEFGPARKLMYENQPVVDARQNPANKGAIKSEEARNNIYAQEDENGYPTHMTGYEAIGSKPNTSAPLTGQTYPVQGIANAESSLNPNARNPEGTSHGLYGFNAATRHDAGLSENSTPEEETALMNELHKARIDRYKGNEDLAILSHNIGITGADEVAAGKRAITPQQQAYVDKVRGYRPPSDRPHGQSLQEKEQIKSNIELNKEKSLAEFNANLAAEKVAQNNKAELQKQTQEKDIQAERDYQGASDAIREALPLMAKSTASGIGKTYDDVMAYFGNSTEGADAAAALDVIGGRLVSMQPKMSGPQSDKDVLLYQKMAGNVADSTKPISQRLNALRSMKALMDDQAKRRGSTVTETDLNKPVDKNDLHSRADAILRGE